MKDAAAILQERAAALAARPADPPPPGSMMDVLEFRLAHERYAVETPCVREVLPFRSLTVLPCVPAFVRGIVNVRGRILPVIDLKRFFDLPDRGITDLHRIVLLEGPGADLGLLADAIGGVRSLPRAALQEQLPTFTGIRADYLHGVTGDGLVVLAARRILEDPRIVVNEEVTP